MTGEKQSIDWAQAASRVSYIREQAKREGRKPNKGVVIEFCDLFSDRAMDIMYQLKDRPSK